MVSSAARAAAQHESPPSGVRGACCQSDRIKIARGWWRLWGTHLDERDSGRVHDLQQLHDGRTIVGDGNLALVIMNQLVHPARAQRGPHHVDHRLARVDVADELRLALRGVGALLEQDNLRLHELGRMHGCADWCLGRGV